jgi:hypothetical protein
MTERNAQAPAADEPIRNISRGGTSRSLPKRKDRALSSPQAEASSSADDIRTRIEKLAYALYQQRGQQDGYDCEDWLEAERMVQAASASQRKQGSGRTGTPTLHSA